MKVINSLLALCALSVAIVAVEATLTEFSAPACPARPESESPRFPDKAWNVEYGQAQAVPAFARKFNLTCTTCHSAYPYLNGFGRKFKRAGYRMPDEDGSVDPDMQNHRTISKNLVLDETFPLALGMDGDLLSLRSGGEAEMAPFGQLTLIGAGNFGTIGSYYVNFAVAAGEDESGETTISGHGVVGVHPSPLLNVVAGHGNIYHHDPYNSRSPHPIVAQHAHVNQSQFIQMYGYDSGLFYSLGATAGPAGKLGRDRQGYARLAYDFTDNISVGTFTRFGRTAEERDSALAHDDAEGGHDEAAVAGATVPELNDLSAGVDFNATIGSFNTVALVEWSSQKNVLDSSEKQQELVGYAEFFYVITSGDRPLLMPLVRADYAQDLELNRRKVSVTANLSSYILANARIGAEVATDLVVPAAAEKSTRATAFFSTYW